MGVTCTVTSAAVMKCAAMDASAPEVPEVVVVGKFEFETLSGVRALGEEDGVVVDAIFDAPRGVLSVSLLLGDELLDMGTGAGAEVVRANSMLNLLRSTRRRRLALLWLPPSIILLAWAPVLLACVPLCGDDARA